MIARTVLDTRGVKIVLIPSALESIRLGVKS